MSVPTLAERIPERGFPDEGALLDCFLGWVADRGLSLYPHQEEAVLEVVAEKHVLLKTPTGSGKSMVATAALFLALAKCWRGVYTSPIKALVSEKFFEMCRVFGAENVGMMTGDGAVNPDAPILCCTAEILANRALRDGDASGVRVVVMDEFHYYGDKDRGLAWQLPLLTLAGARFLLMSATLGDTSAIEAALEAFTGRPVATVRSAVRPVPLDFHYKEVPIHEVLAWLHQSARTPAYLVSFTQRGAAEQAQALLSTDWADRDEKRALNERLNGVRFDTPYGPTLSRMLRAGVGLHHAGLLPRYRLLVEQLAQEGRLRFICGTDTLGVGINVPIRTVLFNRLCKYDGQKVDIVAVRDFQQLAGRAGRAGFDTSGSVIGMAPEHIIENRVAEMKAAAKGLKKVQKKGPPPHGYKHWDETTFQRLVEGEPESLQSRFQVTHGMVLDLLQQEDAARRAGTPTPGGGMARLAGLIRRAHETRAGRTRHRQQARRLFQALRRAEVIQVQPRASGAGAEVLVNPDLQHDFSLFHSLSLWLLFALTCLDRAAPDYALDVLTLVESILDDPGPITDAQARRARDAEYQRIKAEGVFVDDLKERLDAITHPRPKADWIYEIFNAWAVHHPWVQQENIRPKSVAREMFERYATFAEYVREIEVERSEGVLLRHLSQVYKILSRSVPEAARTDALVELLGWLRATLERVDSSLLNEWERLLQAPVAAGIAAPPPPVDISADERAFRARIRAELHAVHKALAAGDLAEAAAGLHPESALSADDLAAALQGHADGDGAPLVFDVTSRQANRTVLRLRDRHLWVVRHLLEDPEDGSLTLTGEIDLRADTNPAGPLVRAISLEG